MAEVSWVATLSNGDTAVENSGSWTQVPGEKKPWVKLCDFAAREKLHLTSLRVNVDGKTIHLPRGPFDRFDYIEKTLSPNSYSLAYHLEAEMAGGGIESQEHFIDVAAHYDGYAVHYITSINDPSVSWIVVSDGTGRMAETPDKRIHGTTT